MMIQRTVGVLGLVLAALPLSAQEDKDRQLQELQRQLQILQQNFDLQQREYQEQFKAMQRQIEALQQGVEPPERPAAPRDESLPPFPSLRERLQREAARRNAYMDIGLIGTFAAGTSTEREVSSLQLGGHDPNQRGFTVQGVEAIFAGAVDPYFRGNANLLFAVNEEGDSFFELEEAWLETMSLPANLQVRAGQLLTEFGRHNVLHPHSWAFVDVPLVLARLLGPDGLRNPGVRLSWLTPTPFYSEFFLSVQGSRGETAAPFRGGGDHDHGGEAEIPLAFRHLDNDRGVRHAHDLMIAPRYAAAFDLTDTQTLLVGGSAAFGPNASGGEGDNRTEIYGVDLTWKWKSARQQGGYPFVAWQTEALLRRYEAGAFDWDENGDGLLDDGELDLDGDGLPDFLPGESLRDYGLYSQLLYGFRKNWVAGLRFDYLRGRKEDYEARFGRDLLRVNRWRVSPNLTWFPTEYSKLRLQYNFDHRERFGNDHSFWLQWEFILGAHGAHRF